MPSQPGIEAPAKTEKNENPSKTREEQKKQTPEQDPAQAVPQVPARPASEVASSKGQDKRGVQTDIAVALPPPFSASPTPGRRQHSRRVRAQCSSLMQRPQPAIAEEVDVLITMMRPFQHEGLGMDMPQLFAVLRYDEATPVKDGVLQPERRDLLGDVRKFAIWIKKPGAPMWPLPVLVSTNSSLRPAPGGTRPGIALCSTMSKPPCRSTAWKGVGNCPWASALKFSP